METSSASEVVDGKAVDDGEEKANSTAEPTPVAAATAETTAGAAPSSSKLGAMARKSVGFHAEDGTTPLPSTGPGGPVKKSVTSSFADVGVDLLDEKAKQTFEAGGLLGGKKFFGKTLSGGRRLNLKVFRRLRATSAEEAQESSTELNELLDRIGFGWYQIKVLILLAGFPFCEGAEMIGIVGLAQNLEDEWHLTKLQSAMLMIWSIVGLALGSMEAGKIADRRGRRFTILISYFGMTVVSALAAMATGYYSMSIIRALNGFVTGLGVPAAYAMITEITPEGHRAKCYTVFGVMVVLGELWGCTAFCIWMPDLHHSHHWLHIADWIGAPPVIMFFLALCMMQESAHWLLLKGRVAQARVVLSEMARLNGKHDIVESMAADEASSFKTIKHLDTKEGEDEFGWKSLEVVFSKSRRGQVILFCILVFVGALTTFGVSTCMPQLMRELAEHNHDPDSAAKNLFMLRTLGLPSQAAVYFVIWASDERHRLSIAASCVVGCGCLSALGHFHENAEAVVVFSSACVGILAGIIVNTVSLIFTNESFATEIRATVDGIVVGVGRLCSVIAPIVYEVYGETLFLLFVGVSFLAGALAVIPLKPASHALSEFVDEAWEDGGHMRKDEEAEGDASDGSNESELAEDESGGASILFAAGTVGARVELVLMAAGAGFAPGMAISFYLSSFAFFADALEDKQILLMQLMVIFCPGILMLPLHWLLDDTIGSSDRRQFMQLVVGSFVLGFLSIIVPLATTKATVLFLGFLIGCIVVSRVAHCIGMAGSVDSDSQPWAYLGIAAGAAAPLGAMRLLQFGPGSSMHVQFLYFSIPAFFCMASGIFYWWYLQQLVGFERFIASVEDQSMRQSVSASRQSTESAAARSSTAAARAQAAAASTDEVTQDPQPTPVSATSRRVLGRMRSMALLPDEIEQQNVEEANSKAAALWFSAIGSLIGMASTSTLLSMIPCFGTGVEVLKVFSYALLGELFGYASAAGLAGGDGESQEGAQPRRRSATPAESAEVAEVQAPPPQWCKLFLIFSINLMCAGASALLLLPIFAPGRFKDLEVDATNELLLWGFFLIFGFRASATSSLEVVLVTKAQHRSVRRTFVRKLMYVRCVGIAVGLMISLFCCPACMTAGARIEVYSRPSHIFTPAAQKKLDALAAARHTAASHSLLQLDAKEPVDFGKTTMGSLADAIDPQLLVNSADKKRRRLVRTSDPLVELTRADVSAGGITTWSAESQGQLDVGSPQWQHEHTNLKTDLRSLVRRHPSLDVPRGV